MRKIALEPGGQRPAVSLDLAKDDPAATIGGGNPVIAWRGAVEAACQASTQK